MRRIGLNFRIHPLTYFSLLACLLLSCFALPFRTATTSHDCTRTQWHNLIVFFAVNYVAYAATTPSKPGGKWMENLPWAFLSLLLPFAGLGKSIGLAVSHLIYGKDDLGKAISRGAVMIAARSKKWEPPSTHEQLVYVKLPDHFSTGIKRLGLQTSNHIVLYTEIGTHSDANIKTAKFSVRSSEGSWSITRRSHTFHGQTFLPPNYYEWILADPWYLEQLSAALKSRKDIQIGQSKSWIKMLISVAQLILSCITIYRAGGSQFDRYGYACFGLSVFPYTVMSFVNLIFVGILGDYPCLYVMRTAVLDEAKQCGGVVSSDLGILEGPGTGDEKGRGSSSSSKEYIAAWLRTEEST